MKIYAASFNPRAADIAANAENIIRLLKTASAQADLLLLPEAALTGCPLYDLFDDKRLMKQNLDALKEIARHTKDIACVLGYLDYEAKEPTTAAAFIYKGKITKIFDSESVALKGQTLQICLGDITQYKSAPDADAVLNLYALPYRRGETPARMDAFKKAVKKFGAPLLSLNLLGGGDGLVFDGRCAALNRKGGFTFIGGQFAEQAFVWDSEENPADIPFKYDETEELLQALSFSIHDQVIKCGMDKVVLGLSGGLDSAVVAVLAARALGGESVWAVGMPFRYTSELSKQLAEALAKNLKINHERIPIGPAFEAVKAGVLHISSHPKDLTEQNLQARLRANVLMTLSSELGAMVLSCGNKSEAAVGYCTLYGDTCGGLMPLGDVYKSDLYKLAQHINKEREIIPQGIIDRAPTAELATGQTDQDSLPPYPVLDKIIRAYWEEQLPAADIVQKYKIAKHTVADVVARIDAADFKRRQCPPITQTSRFALTEPLRPIAKKITHLC